MAKNRPPMFLFDRLTAPGALWRLNNNSRQASNPRLLRYPTVQVDPKFQEVLRGAKRVVADQTGEFYWLSSREQWGNLQQHPLFRRVRMPFPSLWIEWVMPADIQLGRGKFQHRGHIGLTGVLLRRLPPDGAGLSVEQPPAGTAEIIQCSFIRADTVSGIPLADAFFSLFPLSEEGAILGLAPAFSSLTVGTADLDDPTFMEWFRPAQGHTVRAVIPGLLALNFMNYKNVALVDHQPARSRSSKPQVRSASPGLRYSTIKLPSTATRTLDKMRTAVQQGVALHEVRAHDKTYTAEAPLLGKHVGTYLWGMQVRGDPEHGIVVSDYEVGPPPD